MQNLVLKDFLREYEQKRLKAQYELEKRRNQLYKECPRLQNIEEDLNKCSVLLAKNILLSNNSANKDLQNRLSSLKKEKRELLKKLNIKETFFTPYYECTLCNDTGYISKNHKTIMCTCLRQKIFNIEYNKSNISNLNKENFSNFNPFLYSEKIDSKYHPNVSPRENINVIRQICEKFIDNFDNPEEKNLLFTGSTGLGKTFLSNCIANELLKNGKTVLYQTAPVMLDSIIDYRFGKTSQINDLLDHILNVDFLIIDDLGAESTNSMKISELFNIINTRLLTGNNKITKTLISTNLNVKNLFMAYEERIVSRIRGYYNICPFFGEDIRLKKK